YPLPCNAYSPYRPFVRRNSDAQTPLLVFRPHSSGMCTFIERRRIRTDGTTSGQTALKTALYRWWN
ncbi:MAG: hypothetical protein K8R06_04755, partial [Methanosarcinales archaeon]|nr:hypothetical protein [Methanosarcinales archaeon]